MQRVTTLKSTQQAKDYFNKELSKGDYYAKDQAQEVPSIFSGKTAEKMGLSGEVTRESFYKLIEHENPVTGEQLTSRKNESDNRRAGTDITFSVPKSVSVYWSHTGDERVMNAFEQAVEETMQNDIEPLIEARVRNNGQSGSRVTGNGLWSKFLHRTARPAKERDADSGKLKELVPDPHLHSHVILHNVTWDQEHKNRNGSEGAYVAVEAHEIHLSRPYTEASFHARLAKKLTDQGFAVTRTQNGFELAGFSGDMKTAFSKRTIQIENAAAERNVKSAELKAKLGHSTRGNKNELSMDELREQWDRRFSQAEWDEFVRSANGETDQGDPPLPPGYAISYGIEHCLSRQSVATEQEVLKASLERGMGFVTVDELKQELATRSDLIVRNHDGQRLVTSLTVLREEQEMLSFAAGGIGRNGKLGAANYKAADTFAKDGKIFAWNPDQKAAIEHIANSRDSVTVIRGAAGVGKTTLLSEATTAIEENGKNVFAMAPSSSATEVLKEDGFANAQTIAKFLGSTEEQEEVRGQVILVDEAGMVGTEDMRAIFQVAEKCEARVILSGDYKQISSVPRGQAMRQILEQTNVKAAQVTTVTRQKKSDYREGVELLSQGTKRGVSAGFDRLQEAGFIREVDDKQRYIELAAGYLEAVGSTRGRKPEYKSALVVSPTHAEKDKVTQVIRESLKDQGRLGRPDRILTDSDKLKLQKYKLDFEVRFRGKVDAWSPDRTPAIFKRGDRARVVALEGGEVTVRSSNGNLAILPLEDSKKFDVIDSDQRWFKQLKNLQFTDAEKSNPASYENGQVVQFFQHVGKSGFKAGDRATVVAVSQDGVMVSGSNGVQKELPLQRAKHFQVYEERELAVSPGDRLRITQNGTTYALGSGTKPYRLMNNQLVTVKGFKNDHIELENGRLIDAKFSHLDHGYCSTSFTSQGKTVDTVIVAQTSESGRAANMQQFYVSASRGRHRLVVLTDNVEQLKRSVLRSSDTVSATELASSASRNEELKKTELQAAQQPEEEKRFRRLRGAIQRARKFTRQRVDAWREYLGNDKDPDRNSGGMIHER